MHPIYAYHNLPGSISTTGLGDIKLGGEAQIFALQFEFAVSDRLSIVATKDGYVNFRPDSSSLLSSKKGWANLGAGVKYAFILDPATGTAVSGTATFELPTGNSDVFQGEGKGAMNVILSGLKMLGAWQFAGAGGFQIPFSNEQSTNSFVSAHVSYETCKWFIPLVEMNWFHVLDPGNGTGNYPNQVGGAVPAVINFEGSDFFNLGAVNSEKNRDFVTAAIGFRSRITDSIDAGFAYEVPVTMEKKSIMENRFTVDMVWTF